MCHYPAVAPGTPSRARRSCAVRRRHCLALACFFVDRLCGDMVCSFVSCGSFAVAVCPSARDTCPSRLWEWSALCVPCPQYFLLSSANHMRYTCAQVAFPIPTPSSARLIDIGRVGDDL